MRSSKSATPDEHGAAAAAVSASTPSGRPEGIRLIERLEAIITQDIGGRGLANHPRDNLVTQCRGNLGRAARHLAADGQAVAILTGFYVSRAAQPTIETDGPCGAIALARLLAELGFHVTLVTDLLGEPAMRAGLEIACVRSASVALEVFPFDSDDPSSPVRRSNDLKDSLKSRAFTEDFFRSGPGGRLTHLIAVERAGPSHLAPSHLGATDEMSVEFSLRLCPPEHQNQVYNFRGEIITPYTAKAHMLFDFVRENHLPIRTIGIGDGGNEIGMGSIPWPVLHANIVGGLGARIACRIATDWTIACGVSNWGAYALGAAVACLRGRADVLNEWTDERERELLAALVLAGAVDGVTAKSELSVDGLALDQHLAIWGAIREAARTASRAEA